MICTVDGSAPAAAARSRASSSASSSTACLPPGPMWKILSTWPLTEAIAAPTALAASKCSGLMISLTPGSRSGTRMLPPPTAMSGRSSFDVFTRSIASASITSALATASASRARWAPALSARPSGARPAATAPSVSVGVVPPNTSASRRSR
jgi:hypothetical protein